MRLSHDDILKAEDLHAEEVDVPEWGGSVLVRGMTGRERDELEASMLESRGGRMVQNVANARAKVVACCIVDDDGKRMFTTSDVAALGEKSAAAIDRVFTVASRLSGLAEADVKELAENFGTTPGGSSSSSSPPGSGRRSPGSSRK